MKHKIKLPLDWVSNFFAQLKKTPNGVTVTNELFMMKMDEGYLKMEGIKPIDAYRAMHGEFMEIARILSVETTNAGEVFPFFFDTFLKSLAPTGIGFVTSNKEGGSND